MADNSYTKDGQGGGPLNSYAIAFGILGTGLVLAALMWCRPRVRRMRQVRRFRKDLIRVEAVTSSWSRSLRREPYQDPSDEVPTTLPESRRMRRSQRRSDRDDEGEALV